MKSQVYEPMMISSSDPGSSGLGFRQAVNDPVSEPISLQLIKMCLNTSSVCKSVLPIKPSQSQCELQRSSTPR
jgi:hypothetical protein